MDLETLVGWNEGVEVSTARQYHSLVDVVGVLASIGMTIFKCLDVSYRHTCDCSKVG